MNLQEISDRWPSLVGDNIISFECGGGWRRIIEKMCDKLVDRDVRIMQLKEKFGRLTVYLDNIPAPRIEVDCIKGVKDGDIVDPETPGSDIVIFFYERKQMSKRGGSFYMFGYCPSIDRFYVTASMKYEAYTEDTEYDMEDRDFVKGRLSDLTGLVDAEPVKEESVKDIVVEAELESLKVCEYCGSTVGVTTEGSWRKTLCEQCRENRYKKD